MPVTAKKFVFTDLFLDMHCDRNHDGTKNLVLRGNDLQKKIGKRVNTKDLVLITAFLRRHPEVVALEFPYNEINDCGMFTLANFFKERPIIRYLNIICNNVGPRGIGYLLELGDIFVLRTLRLSGNKIGSEGAKKLSKLLYKPAPLKCLDIADTQQTVEGLAYIITSMMKVRGGFESLEYIDLSRPLPQSFHQVPSAHLAEFISQLIKVNQRLKEIHIEHFRFDFRDAEILQEGLLANKTLICLNLNNNNIGDNGVEYLCQYLKTSPPLECLMIGANNFTSIGAMALGINLPYSKIRLLDISNNRIADEGMLHIFYTIRKTQKLTNLFIWGNKLTHKSLIVLQRLFTAKILDLHHTDVKLYCTDGQLKASWDPRANRYKHRYYCVSDYGCPTIRTIMKIPPPPSELPPIYYRHHVDHCELGLPAADWAHNWTETKFVDPF